MQIITPAVADATSPFTDNRPMYPTVVRIGNFDITSFGVLVALGALVGLWVFGRELARSGLPASASDAAMAGVFGGLAGAKLLWVIEHLGDEPFTDLLFSRGGMSWFGGLAGGIGTALILMRHRRLPVVATLAAATPALAIVAWLLIRWRRQGVPDAVVLGRYLVLAGSIRFAIEFLRVNVRVIGPFTLAHLISLGLVGIGAPILARASTEVPS